MTTEANGANFRFEPLGSHFRDLPAPSHGGLDPSPFGSIPRGPSVTLRLSSQAINVTFRRPLSARRRRYVSLCPASVSRPDGLMLAPTALARHGRERAPRHGSRPGLASPPIAAALGDGRLQRSDTRALETTPPTRGSAPAPLNIRDTESIWAHSRPGNANEPMNSTLFLGRHRRANTRCHGHAHGHRSRFVVIPDLIRDPLWVQGTRHRRQWIPDQVRDDNLIFCPVGA